MASTLVGRGIEHFRVAGIHMHFVEACVVRHMEHAAPVLAAVRRLVDAAVAAGTPNRAIGSHPHDVGVAGVHGNHADVLRILEAHVGPGMAAVLRAVDAIAVGYGALVVVLARADPNGIGVAGVQGHAANGVGTFAVKNGFKGQSVVFR